MIIALLLQAVPLPGNSQQGLATEIAVHPYVALAILGGLVAVTLAVIKVLLHLLEARINDKFDRIEKDFVAVRDHDMAQDGRLDKIDHDLRIYEKNVAVGVKETSEIHAAITRVADALTLHSQREEQETWGKIDSLVEAVNSMKLDNTQAHANMVTQQSVLETRLGAVEKKLPNGELSRLAHAFEELSKRHAAATTRRSTRGKK